MPEGVPGQTVGPVQGAIAVRAPLGVVVSIGLLLLLQTLMLAMSLLALVGSVEDPCVPDEEGGDCWAAGFGFIGAVFLVPFSVACLTIWFVLLWGVRRGFGWAPRMASWVSLAGIVFGVLSLPVGLPWIALNGWLRYAGRPASPRPAKPGDSWP